MLELVLFPRGFRARDTFTTFYKTVNKTVKWPLLPLLLKVMRFSLWYRATFTKLLINYVKSGLIPDPWKVKVAR